MSSRRLADGRDELREWVSFRKAVRGGESLQKIHWSSPCREKCGSCRACRPEDHWLSAFGPRQSKRRERECWDA